MISTSALLLALAVPPVIASKVSEPERQLAHAAELIARAEYVPALALLLKLEKNATLSDEQRARLYAHIATVRVETGQSESALKAAELSEQIAQRLGSADLLGRVALTRGAVWRQRGFTLRAPEHYRHALALGDRTGDRARVAAAYAQLAVCYQHLGDWPRALDYAERAFEANPSPTDDARFRYLTQRGIAYYEFFERDLAERSFTQARSARRTSCRVQPCP